MGISARIAEVTDRIEKARLKSDRGNTVALLAAVKGREGSEVREAIDAGIRFIGENRVQEAEARAISLPREKINYHFIGNLQSNKAQKVLRLFDSIDSVDSAELAVKLAETAEKTGLSREVMIEVNLGEVQKGGARPDEIRGLADSLCGSSHLSLTGLMGVPPYSEDPSGSRPYFQRLRRIFDEIKKSHPAPEKFKWLSMGMSNDFEIAVEEGATMVRIGTVIFGPRRSK